MDGIIGLAAALSSLSAEYYVSQGVTQEILANTAADYLGVVTSDTAVVTADQQKCVAYATDATTGNTQDAIEAAKWNTRCSIASAQMNSDMGAANTAVNTEDNELEVQDTNSAPILAVDENMSGFLKTISEQIISFQR